MTVDVSMEMIIGASLFVGGQLVTLASVVRSNRDQGRRLGKLEDWKAAVIAVKKDRAERMRVRTAAGGVPISEDDQ
jgi:hypothetical protein